MTNKNHRVLYTGVTSNIAKRVYEHKEGITPGFTKRYNVKKIVYYEVFDDIRDAITREKQIKKGSRRKKLELINSFNPQWRDLSDELWF